MSKLEPKEKARRKRERILVFLLTVTLVAFTLIEVHLLKVSSRLPFLNSIFFFGLMNLNLILIMLLLFLVFRNGVKLVLDERRGKIGAKLKTQLVFCFLLFAIIPTVFLFTISAFYIKSSFDKWFSVQVGDTLQRSLDVAKDYYDNTEKKTAHFAKKIAGILEPIPKSNTEHLNKKLQELRTEYGLDAVEYYADAFSPRVLSVLPEKASVVPSASLETLQRAMNGKNECKVLSAGAGELIRCGSYLGPGRGMIFASSVISMGVASQLSEIHMSYKDYLINNPLNYPIKSTYFAILIMATLLILFTATWTGFYAARRLTGPIEQLSKGTQQVAGGNLDYQIPESGSDEMRALIQSFNSMTMELKQTTEEVHHRRRYIEVLLESVQSGVLSLDNQGCISMINAAASDLLNLGNIEGIGKPYTVAFPEEHHEEIRELFHAVVGTAKPVRKELRIQGHDGQWSHIMITASVLRDENRKHRGIVAVLDDVSDIQKMERMLAWREVAKRIAHEIKNPLTPIQLSVQRLRRRYLDKIDDGGTFGEATEIILKEVDSLKMLVNEFSSFARLPEIQQNPENLNQILLEAVNLYRAAHESIQFNIQFDDAIPNLDLDRSQLKRVLFNLFDNAVAAMEGKGKIDVESEWASAAGMIRFTVADHGVGLTHGDYQRWFEPYFSTKKEGTGLGLAIVQRIIADHGGFVRASSNQPKGTIFTIELPDRLIVRKGRLKQLEARV